VRVIFVSVVIVVLDQFTKLLVKGFSLPGLGISVEGMRYGSSREILGDFFRLTYIENPGMAFGIDVGGQSLLAIVSLIASVAIAFYLYHSRNEPLSYRFPLAMILGGAVGNLIDRTFYGFIFGGAPFLQGRVVDFLDLDFFDISVAGFQLSRWPVFNIADASVTIGVLLLLFVGRAQKKAALAPLSAQAPVPVPDPPEQH
jgi:signal peptidase II